MISKAEKKPKILIKTMIAVILLCLTTIISSGDDKIDWDELSGTYVREVNKFKVIDPVDETDLNLKVTIKDTGIVYEYVTIEMKNEISITSHTERINTISSLPLMLEGVVVSDYPIARLSVILPMSGEEIITKIRKIDERGRKVKFIHPIKNMREGTSVITVVAQDLANNFITEDVTFNVLKRVKFTVKGKVKNAKGLRYYDIKLTRFGKDYAGQTENLADNEELPKEKDYSFDIMQDGSYEISIKAIDYKKRTKETKRNFIIDTSPPQIVVRPQRIFIRIHSSDFTIKGNLFDVFGIKKVVVYDPHNSNIFSEAVSEKRSDGSYYTNAEFQTKLKNLTPGIHQFVISAFDMNDNVSQEYFYIEYVPK